MKKEEDIAPNQAGVSTLFPTNAQHEAESIVSELISSKRRRKSKKEKEKEKEKEVIIATKESLVS